MLSNVFRLVSHLILILFLILHFYKTLPVISTPFIESITMTLRLYITGHGEWRPKDGYTKVPKSCTFLAPINFGKVMADCDVRTLLAGDWKRKPEIIANQFKTIPNYRWHPLTANERKKDLEAFEFYRKKTANLNAKYDAFFQKGIIPANQPKCYQSVASRAAPKMSQEELQAFWMEKYKPGFIHSGDSMVFYPDKDSPGDASAIISCPIDTVMTLEQILKSLKPIIEISIKNYDNVEIIWACCQAISLKRVGSVDRITNQIDSIGGYMHMDDLIIKKKLVLDPKLKVEFVKRNKMKSALNSNKVSVDVDNVPVTNYNMLKTVNNINALLVQNGMAI